MVEARGGQWDRERPGDVAVGDCGEKPHNCPVGSPGNSSEEVMLRPPSESSCPSGKRRGENFRFLLED